MCTQQNYLFATQSLSRRYQNYINVINFQLSISTLHYDVTYTAVYIILKQVAFINHLYSNKYDIYSNMIWLEVLHSRYRKRICKFNFSSVLQYLFILKLSSKSEDDNTYLTMILQIINMFCPSSPHLSSNKLLIS